MEILINKLEEKHSKLLNEYEKEKNEDLKKLYREFMTTILDTINHIKNGY